MKLIERIAKFRAKEAVERSESKPAVLRNRLAACVHSRDTLTVCGSLCYLCDTFWELKQTQIKPSRRME